MVRRRSRLQLIGGRGGRTRASCIPTAAPMPSRRHHPPAAARTGTEGAGGRRRQIPGPGRCAQGRQPVRLMLEQLIEGILRALLPWLASLAQQPTIASEAEADAEVDQRAQDTLA